MKKSNDAHKPWFPKIFTRKCDVIKKIKTENIIPFLISAVCDAPIKIPSN